jgi:probable phosphoglycerate mutase
MTEFLLIRHAVTDASDRCYAGRMAGVGLNERGIRDAEELGRRLDNITIDALYSSPLDRCLQTAKPIADRKGLPVEVDPSLLEFDIGDWTGKSFPEMQNDPLFRRFNKFRSGTRPPKGELAVEVQARMVGTILRLAAAHPDTTVAVVGHSDPIQLVLAYFLGIAVEVGYRLSVDPASVSILAISEDDVRVKLVNHRGPLGTLEV